MAEKFRNAKIQIQPGTNRTPDSTDSDTLYYVDTNRVRHEDGRLKKIGGCEKLLTTGETSIVGTARTIFSYFYNGKNRWIIGTHKRLYSLEERELTNITPLKTTPETLGSDPLSVTLGSATITITDTNSFEEGDRIKIDGATTTGGIPDTEINAEHIIHDVTASDYKITVTTTATSTTTGGGAAVDVYEQIDAGAQNFSDIIGYGGGIYGSGAYGVSQAFSTVYTLPRIWSMGRFGNDVITTPGDGGKIYIYQSDTDTAPTVLTNAPTESDYVFIDQNAVISLYGNSIKTSTRGDATEWTPSPTTLAFQDEIEGAEDFVCATNVRGTNLLFTSNQIYTFKYVGLPNIWITSKLDVLDGIIARNAVVSASGVAFWMGNNNFYVYDGGIVSAIPNNTLSDYIFKNINRTSARKIHSFVNREYNEVWWFIPLGTNTECNYYVKYNYIYSFWEDGFWSRTSSETPLHLTTTPLLTGNDTYIYKHESGVNDDGSAMNEYAITNYAQIGNGDNVMNVTGFIPDATQEGNRKLQIYTKMRQQGDAVISEEKTITPTTEKVDFRASGRFRAYKIYSDELDTNWKIGQEYEMLKTGGRF
ncbi:MAG: hypothetical protein AMJ43_07765 [Coxiella sp. DG_40]|nr:MAG: hypothetical protein AMJ43_07765 [Coxiella sp. DG_40]